MQRKGVQIGELARATLLWWLVPAILIGALAIVAALAQLAAQAFALRAGEDEARGHPELKVAVGAPRPGLDRLDLQGGPLRGRPLGDDVEGEPQGVGVDAGEGAYPQYDPVDAACAVCAGLGQDTVHRRGHDSDFVHLKGVAPTKSGAPVGSSTRNRFTKKRAMIATICVFGGTSEGLRWYLRGRFTPSQVGYR